MYLFLAVSAVVSVAAGLFLSELTLTLWEWADYGMGASCEYREVCRNCSHYCFHLGTYDRELREIVCPCPVTLEKMRALDVCNEYTHWKERSR